MNKRQTTLGIYSVEFYVCKYQYVYLSIPSMILNIIVRVRAPCWVCFYIIVIVVLFTIEHIGEVQNRRHRRPHRHRIHYHQNHHLSLVRLHRSRPMPGS